MDAPPPALYVKGKVDLLNRPAIAIVGSRQASGGGLTLARRFAGTLGAAGLVIISGLARGIDSAAHEASLATGTIAVLAGGIDVVYPSENTALQQQIAEAGVLVTEMPPGFAPRAQDFPRRNRIISGISNGVLVIEAARRSGTLLTARMALEQGREVFAVPGHPLDPRAEGTNHLLKSGATIATTPQDILDVIQPIAGLAQEVRENETATYETAPQDPLPPPLIANEDRARTLEALGPHPIPTDDLARAVGLGPREMRVILMELDLAGLIERHGQTLVSRKADSAPLAGT